MDLFHKNWNIKIRGRGRTTRLEFMEGMRPWMGRTWSRWLKRLISISATLRWALLRSLFNAKAGYRGSRQKLLMRIQLARKPISLIPGFHWDIYNYQSYWVTENWIHSENLQNGQDFPKSDWAFDEKTTGRSRLRTHSVAALSEGIIKAARRGSSWHGGDMNFEQEDTWVCGETRVPCTVEFPSSPDCRSWLRTIKSDSFLCYRTLKYDISYTGTL